MGYIRTYIMKELPLWIPNVWWFDKYLKNLVSEIFIISIVFLIVVFIHILKTTNLFKIWLVT
jgi:hypothetical protein